MARQLERVDPNATSKDMRKHGTLGALSHPLKDRGETLRLLDDINSGAIKVLAGFTTDFGQIPSPEDRFPETTGVEMPGLQKGGDLAQKLGAMLGNWAAGPGAAGPGFFRAAEVAGGGAHQFVYGAGRFFGKNFKPWED